MNLIQIDDNKNNIVVKHNELVWEARYRLSELGIKVMSVLISMINSNDDDFHQYSLKINDFKELIGSDSKNTYEYTHNMIRELLSKTLKIGDEQFAWISYGKHIEGSDIVTFEINRHLKPYLLAIKSNFLQYNIINILPLRSSYVIRLYELFKSKWSEYKHYNQKSKSYTFELKIDWLRNHFEIPDSYRYNDIKRIIEKARKQFKEKTDIQFDYKEQKIGRKVDRLIITVRENTKGSNDFLKDLKTFIAYMRKNFVNQDIWQGQGMILSVDEKGRIYNKLNLKEYNKNDSKKVWETWYELAKQNKFRILKQGKLF